MVPFTEAKTPEEINKLKQQAFQAQQAGLLSQARTTEINRLLDEKEKAEQLGNQILVDQINSQLQVLFPSAGGGQEAALVPAKDIVAAMARTAGARVPSDLPERKFTTQQEQTAVEIEQQIREKPRGRPALSRYQDFNRYSNRNKVAVNDDGKIKFIKLPRVGGRLLTASQVHVAAAQLEMTIEEYVVNVLKIPEAIKVLK